jgi:serine/threonine protein kinase/Tol biopolymer transport system component
MSSKDSPDAREYQKANADIIRVDADRRSERPPVIGQTIGAYTVTAKIGEGGMGEVFRARDTRLGRDVAIKIIPAAFSRDPDRLARFEREARTLATLNHPHVAQIYGFEQSDATSALVMEFIDGEDLSERIARGAIPPDEATAIARQVAAALEAAHEIGIVHRDLKPANIKINAAGNVKVLDFGLAKAVEAHAAAAATAAITSPAMTAAGIILGTAAYMSPEQARGLPVDRRTDIWAFGVVVLEMLTGKRVFRGDTVSDAIAAILTQEPNWSDLPAATHPRVAELIRRCLRKDPKRRLRDIGDAVVELDEVIAGAPANTAMVAASRSSRSYLPWVTALLAIVAAAAVAWSAMPLRQAAVRSRSVTRASIALPPSATMFLGRGSSVAMSPDGTRIVYVATDKARTQLYLRAVDQMNSVALPGTDGAANPFFSPDGQWVGFTADAKLKKVSLQGRTIATIIDAPNIRGEAWTPDDRILFTPNNGAPLMQVPAGGGSATGYTSLADGELSHRWPQVAPSGRAVVFTIWNDTGFEGGRVAVQRLDGSDRKVLVQGGGYGRIVETPAGRAFLVYAQGDGLLAAPLDLDRLELTAAVTSLNEAVASNLSGGAHFAFSSTGDLVYAPGTLSEAASTLLWVDRDGKEEVAAAIDDLSVLMSATRDGRRLVRLNSQGPSRDVFVHDLESGSERRLTNGGFHGRPQLTADERRVIYTAGLPNLNFFWRPIDGAGEEERLTTSPNAQFASSISPDGKTLVYAEFDPVTASDIWELSLDGGHAVRPLVKTRFSEGNASLSPDGRWMAYQSNETGRFEVYVTSYPNLDTPIRVTSAGGIRPMWNGDGRELYYRVNDRFMALPMTFGAAAKAGEARLLFAGNYLAEGQFVPGPQKFLLIREKSQEGAGRTLNLVLGWFDDLTAKATPR